MEVSKYSFEYKNSYTVVAAFSSVEDAQTWFRENKPLLYSKSIYAERVDGFPNQIRLCLASECRSTQKINLVLENMGIISMDVPSRDYVKELTKDLTKTYDIAGVDYRITGLISSQGCYGDVFSAENEIGEKVVIKVLRTQGDHEALILNKIDQAGGHPNIVKYIAGGRILDRDAIVMEYIDGKMIGRDGWTVDLEVQYDDALDFLRSIKVNRECENENENVMVTTINGLSIVKLIDFGTLARR